MSRYVGPWVVVTLPGGAALHPCPPELSDVSRVVGWLTHAVDPGLLPSAVWTFDPGASDE